MSAQLIYCPTCQAANEEECERCFACQAMLNFENVASRETPLLHGRYRLLEQLGTGGFGAVYRAEDVEQPDLSIAIKQINLNELSARQIIEATETFQRERTVLVGLRHPRLPRLYETFEDPEHWYLVIDFFPGETLETYLARQKRFLHSAIPESAWVEEVLFCGLQLCEVLDYLHTRTPPVIFRDLKPGNIMRGPQGSYALIDFGIARMFKPGQAKDTIPLGSPGYAAPEQYGRAQTDARADLYSLGAILHQMLSGHDPSEQPLHFTQLRYADPTLQRLEALVRRMVSSDAGERPGSAKEVAEELRTIKKAYQQPGARIWIPQESQTPPSDLADAQANGGAGQIQLQIQRPLTPRQRRQQASPQFSRRRRKLLLAGLVTGGVLVGGGGLGSYLVNRFSTAQTIWEGETLELIDVAQVAWSADGHYLTALGMGVSSQIGVMLWDIQLQKYIWFHSFPYQSQTPVPSQAVAWAPDGQSFAIAEGTYLSLWFVSNDEARGFRDNILQKLIIYPDGNTFTMSGKGLVDTSLNTVLWSPDGRYLAYGGGLSASIWDTRVRKLLLTYQGHAKEPLNTATNLSLFWSPDGRYIASFVKGNQTETSLIHVWQVKDGATIATIQSPQLDSSQDVASWVQWSPDSRYLAYGIRGSSLNAYDIQSDESFTLIVNQPMPSPGLSVLLPMASWSPDGKYLATFSNNVPNQGFIEILQLTGDGFRVNLTSGQSAPAALQSWSVSNTVAGVSWSPNGRSLVAIGYDNDTSYTLRFYDPTTQSQRVWANVSGSISSLAWSPDGRYLAVWVHDFSTSRVMIHAYSV